MIKNNLQNLPLIGIIRGITDDCLLGCIEAAANGGLNTLEITMNTNQATDLIKKVSKEFPEIHIGAGTVTTIKRFNEAVEAGAQYIIMPHTSETLAKLCKKHKVPFFCGALTPTEIHKAWELGSEMVKVFPVKSIGGFSYIKELKGPFDNIKLLACGGVNPDNINNYIQAGTDAIAIGSQIFKQEWMAEKNYKLIKKSAEKFVSLLKQSYDK